MSFTFDHPRGFSAIPCHDDAFTGPMSYSANLADTNIAVKSNGQPFYRDGKVVLLFPQKASPGTFASRGGKLRKAGAVATIKSQRWQAPEGEAHARKMDRFDRGWLATKAGAMPCIHERAPSGPPPPAPASIQSHWGWKLASPTPKCGPPHMKQVWISASAQVCKVKRAPAPEYTPPPPAPPPPAFRGRTLADLEGPPAFLINAPASAWAA